MKRAVLLFAMLLFTATVSQAFTRHDVKPVNENVINAVCVQTEEVLMPSFTMDAIQNVDNAMVLTLNYATVPDVTGLYFSIKPETVCGYNYLLSFSRVKKQKNKYNISTDVGLRYKPKDQSKPIYIPVRLLT